MEIETVQKSIKAPPGGNRPKYLWLLPIFLVIISVVVVAGYFFPKKESATRSPFDLSNLSAYSDATQARFKDFTDLAIASAKPEVRAENYAKSFLVLSAAYDGDPTDKKRLQLQTMFAYLQKNYPDITLKQHLAVPCRQEACGAKFNFTDELTELKKAINSLKVAANVKESLNHNLENTALALGSNHPEAAFGDLAVNFDILKTVWKQNKDPQVKVVAEVIQSELKNLSPEFYANSEKRGYFKLDD